MRPAARVALGVTALVCTALSTTARAEGPGVDHGYAGPVLTTLGAIPRSNAPTLATGYGASFRVHGAPAVALDLGAAYVDGADDARRARREIAGSLLVLLYPSPGGAVQPFFLAGPMLSWARVTRADAGSPDDQARFHHAGIVGGAGLELFVWPRVALTVDGRAFVRRKLGGGQPEWIAKDGRESDTSAGVLATVGVAFYVLGK